MSKYGQALREAALHRILPPNSEPMAQVARDFGISIQTLVNWKKKVLAENGKMYPNDNFKHLYPDLCGKYYNEKVNSPYLLSACFFTNMVYNIRKKYI